MALKLLFLLGVLKLASCFHCKMSDSERKNAKSFDQFEHLFEKDTPAFIEAVFQQVGDDGPELEDLIEVGNEISGGKVPKFVIDGNYVLSSNHTGELWTSDGNAANLGYLIYDVFNSTDTRNFYSMLYFGRADLKLESEKYNVAESLYSRIDYIIRDDDTIQWLANSYGVFIIKLPDGTYVPYGNITSAARGNAVLSASGNYSITVLDITDTEVYYSETVTNVIGNVSSSEDAYDMGVFSLTGGTNATMQGYAGSASNGNIYGITNGTLFNSKEEAEWVHKSIGHTPVELDDPKGEDSLRRLFSKVFLSVGVSLDF